MKRQVVIVAALGLILVGLSLPFETLSGGAAAQQTTAIDAWREVTESSIVSRGRRVIVPEVYRTLRLNRDALGQVLALAPLEFTAAARSREVLLSVPLPDGTRSRFRIEESPVMEPGLAARAPEIKTYRGQGIDDPTATARFDMTPAGFHAIILSATETIYIDPYAKGDTTNYISYFKRHLSGNPRYECRFGDFDPAASDAPAPNDGEGFAPLVVSQGGTLRTYRLALAVTGEYTLYHSELLDSDEVKKQKALAALTTTLNRVNGIYEREVSVRMVLVEDQLEIVYTNPATDPYQSDMVIGASMLVENQINLDTPEPAGPIGEGNYDIGHVMSTGFGGVAFLDSVCDRGNPNVPGDGFNAGGFTGLDTPEGDPFDVDFVAHEMGHQFGGNHTFNGSEGSCGGNEGADSAYEPGSGSTIQAYAGICGAQDLQPHSDDYFHIKSLEELVAFTRGGGNGCSVRTPVNNAAPVVNAGVDYTIPKNTPFTLTATANDPDGDPLTYGWEEYDLGPSAPPDNDNDGQARPIFRSYKATTNPARTFPSLRYILDNANTPPATYDCGRGAADPCLTGEDLPSFTRTMRFQVTARDNRAAGGGTASDLAQVNVNGGAGPFIITAPNTGVTWAGQSMQAVTWSVANTSAAPVNALNVKISLSTDGGQTFPIVLAENTPNDGAETLFIPNTSTSAARIKVEAVGNIFFDISNTNFNITLDQSACLTNHALTASGATATASSTTNNASSGSYPAAAAINGDRTGAGWGAGTGGWNDATRGVYPDWLQVDFNGSQTLNLIRVYTLQDSFFAPVEPSPLMTATYYGLRDFEVQYWDGAAWATVPGGSVSGNNLVMRSFAFASITTPRIRVFVGDARNNFSRIVEVEAFGCATP